MQNDRLAWPILLLLLTVLVPSLGVVWMMREAVLMNGSPPASVYARPIRRSSSRPANRCKIAGLPS